MVVDGVCDVVWVTRRVNGVMGGGGRRLRCHLSGVAREQRCGWSWTAFAVSFE